MFIAETQYPGAPLTQAEMNAAAGADLKKTLFELETVQGQIRLKLPPDRLADFDKANTVWKDFMVLWARFEADFYKGGTFWPSIYSTTADTVVTAHLEFLKNYAKYLDTAF